MDSPANPSNPRLRDLAVALGLAALVWLTYGNSLEAGFAFDSSAIILNAPQMRAATAENVRVILGNDYWWPMNIDGLYRPVASLSYLLNFSVLGNADRPLGYHVVNLILHWINALLVFALARRVVRFDRRPAFLLAALFATHPVGPESVTNIVGRADQLAAMSVLAAIWLHVLALEARGTRRALLLAALALTIGLGLLSKENAISAAGAIVLYDLLYRLDRPSGASGGSWMRQVRELAWPDWAVVALPFAIVLAIRLYVFAGVLPLAPDYAEKPLLGLGFWTARLTAQKTLARTLTILAWPRILCADYSLGEIPTFRWPPGDRGDVAALALPLAIALLVAFLLRLTRRGSPRGRAALFFVGFFFATWLPTSNLLVVLGNPLADRYLYLQQIGFLGLVVLAVEALAASAGPRLARLFASAAPQASSAAWSGALAWIALGAIALGFAARTRARNLDWRSDLTLWSSAVESCPASFHSHKGFGAALAAGDAARRDAAILDRAIAESELAQAIVERSAPPGTPPSGVVLEGLGTLYLRKADLLDAADAAAGRPAESGRAWAEKAADTLARAAAWYDRMNEARRRERAARGLVAEESFELGQPSVFDDLGRAELRAGRPDRALAAFTRERRLAIGSAGPYVRIAEAQRALGQNEAALTSVLQALLVDPSRRDLAPLLLSLYRAVDPGGCALVERDGGYAVDPACPATPAIVCRAYDAQVRAYLEARHASAEERAAAAEHLRAIAEPTFHCAEAGFPDLRPGSASPGAT